MMNFIVVDQKKFVKFCLLEVLYEILRSKISRGNLISCKALSVINWIIMLMIDI